MLKVAITGATGFLGRYIVRHLIGEGHSCRLWHRPDSDRTGLNELGKNLEWCPGDLSDSVSMRPLVKGCDAVIHAALDRPGAGFRGSEGDIAEFVERNVLGTIRLIETSRAGGVRRFIFISTCAVHEVILPDRRLDEAHPLWPTSHYGAHKAAIEKFVHSYGLGTGYEICSLRPTGIYGLAHPARKSRWYDLAHAVAKGKNFSSDKGGKEVHASDVAKAVGILLTAPGVAGQAYNCYDRYIAEQEVASIAKRLSGSAARIDGANRGPKNQIDTSKISALGMTFGGNSLLERTIAELLAA